jgi:uncharacterized protein
MPPLPGLRVVRSKIQGYGVIATRPFKAGEVIADVDGMAWKATEERDDRYSLLIDDGVLFEMLDQTRWINHSCDPNADVDMGGDEEGGYWAQIVASRDIAAGEEIVYDYAFDPAVAEPCCCGTPACRGMIIDADALEMAKQAGLPVTVLRTVEDAKRAGRGG